MKLVVVGLGKMGAQIAEMLIKSGHSVIAVDPNPVAVMSATGFGAIAADTRVEAASKFGHSETPIVWIMIPAKFVTDEIAGWREVLPEHSILIDGGNTDFRETKKHAEFLNEKSIKFIDVGTSGGVLGLEQGFSMMVGGDESAYRTVAPILDVLAGARGGHEYFGSAGAGHYVKMVHNAIEYGMMESLAEGYRMLREGAYKSLDLEKVGDVWQQASVIESTLNKLAAEVMHEDQQLTDATGYVAESGEAKWTLEIAKEHSIDLPAIQTALDVRVASQTGEINYTTKLLAELRNKFGGHPLNTNG